MIKRFQLCIVSCFLTLILSLQPGEAKKSVQLCFEDEDYSPYFTGDSQKVSTTNPGILVELSKAAFETAGLSVEFIRRPWKRCMHMLKDNDVAGMFGVIYLPEREKIGRYPMQNGEIDTSRRIVNADYSIFRHVSRSSFGWNGKTFKKRNLKLAVPLGYAMVKSLEENHKVVPNTSFLPDVGLGLVAQEKLDGYIVEKRVGLHLLNKLNLGAQVEPHTPPFSRHPLYLFLSHGFYENYSKESEKVWSTLAVLRKTVLDDLMKKYIPRNQ